VGGTPIQNVGAYGQEISDVLTAVRAFDRMNEKAVELSRSDCRFSYRSSMFNTTEKDRYIVLGVTYALGKDGEPSVSYPDLRRRLESTGRLSALRLPTLREVRQVVLEIRAGKGMLLTGGDPDCRSAGSFFRNPIVTEAVYAGLQQSIAEAVPRYPAGAGYVKTSAAWLIERAGLAKGFAIGPAALSRKHVLAVVNTGGATAADIVRLAREVRARVEGRFGIRLVPEPVFVGFDESF
jgi:UDP-N-acetylmuramate dehydrogenase